LIRFGKQVKDNEFAYNLLKRLVADYINYFGVRGPERQRLADELELSGGKGYLINTDKGDRVVYIPDSKSQKFLPPQKSRKPRRKKKK
jgi:hypothetical protein